MKVRNLILGSALTLISSSTLTLTRADNQTVHFPAGFQWCVATAAHQIEGGDTTSDWNDWEQIPGHVQNGEKPGLACDHWHRVAQDIGLMNHLGVSTYRFSVEWAKIEPKEGVLDSAAITHYQQEVAALHAAGIAPMITLQHFTLPSWLRAKGGWEWAGSADAFERFTKLVYEQIAPGERDWITVNEPMVHILGGYYEGETPPGEHRSFKGLIPVIRGLLTAHARAYHMLHALAYQQGAPIRVGMAHHLRTEDAYHWYNPIDVLGASIADQIWNWMLPDALENGRLEMHMLWLANDSEEIPGLAGTQDFVGVNYYTGDRVEFSLSKGLVLHTRPKLPKNDLGWDIYPKGFSRVLHSVNDRYSGKPIIVTENGIADAKDAQRPEFLREHLAVMAAAIGDGIPVEGYCHWSLMDNFEWISGFEPRFGLYETNYTTYERIARPSAELYREIIQNNGFTYK